MAAIQRRRGPSVVGILGTLQPFADGLKLFIKEIFIPAKANKFLFILSPILFLAFALLLWSIMPLSVNSLVADLNLGILYILAISSLSVYGLILGGWSSNSQYAFLGSLRSAAQMISYEIALSIIILTVVVYAQSLNLSTIILTQKDVWFLFPLFPAFLMFFISSLAETSRPPFDLPEAEAELVSGYNLEYASMGFAFYFIAEYSNIIFMSFFCTALFLGGWLPIINLVIFSAIKPIIWFSIKSLIVIIGFIWVRAAFPRYRYDQLMNLTWTVFLPFSLAIFALTFVLNVFFSF